MSATYYGTDMSIPLPQILISCLEDPIAMSWVNAVGDPYALASLAKKGLNYCSLLVTEGE